MKKNGSQQDKATAQDALELLKDDHKNVKKLFKEFDKLKEESDTDQKKELVATICDELLLHAQLEEEIFYPVVRDAIDDDDLLDEAEVEHAAAKDLIEQLLSMEPDDELYDAKVTVLSEEIDHHVEEEEGEMFKKIRKAKLDTDALGQQMEQRKLELMEEMGMEPSGMEVDTEQSEGRAGNAG